MTTKERIEQKENTQSPHFEEYTPDEIPRRVANAATREEKDLVQEESDPRRVQFGGDEEEAVVTFMDPVDMVLHDPRPKARPAKNPLKPYDEECERRKHPYAIPLTHLPPWERRTVGDGELGPEPERPRQVMIELQRDHLLQRHKDAVVTEEAHIKDRTLQYGRAELTQMIRELERELEASVAAKDAEIARLGHQCDSWRKKFEHTNRQLKGVLGTLREREDGMQKDITRALSEADAANAELKRLKDHHYLTNDALARLKQEVAIAQDEKKRAEKDGRLAQDRIRALTQERARIQGDAASLERRVELLTTDLNRVKADRDRSDRQNDVLEAQQTSAAAELNNATSLVSLKRRIAELEDEVLRVQRNNGRVLGLLNTLARGEDVQAVKQAAELVKVVNGNFSFLGFQKHISAALSDGSTLPARCHEMRTATTEFTQTQQNLLRAQSVRHRVVPPAELAATNASSTAGIAGCSADGKNNNSSKQDVILLAEETWIPSQAFDVLNRFKLQYFHPHVRIELADVFLLLLKELWSVMRNSLGEEYHKSLLVRHQPKQVVCPGCQALHSSVGSPGKKTLEKRTSAESIEREDPQQSAAVGPIGPSREKGTPRLLDELVAEAANGMAKNDVHAILRDGVVLDAVRSVSSLKRMLVVADSVVFPTEALTHHQYKSYLKTAIRTVHSLLARTERVSKELLLSHADEKTRKGGVGATKLLAEVAPALECRATELSRAVDMSIENLRSLLLSGEKPDVEGTWNALLADLNAYRDTVTIIRREVFGYRDDLLNLLSQHFSSMR